MGRTSNGRRERINVREDGEGDGGRRGEAKEGEGGQLRGYLGGVGRLKLPRHKYRKRGETGTYSAAI